MSNKLKYLVLVVFIAIAVLFVLVWAGVIPGLRSFSRAPIKAELMMWGMDDKPDVYNKMIANFQNANPGIKVKYVQKPKDTYEDDLIRAFAVGQGPDIFSIRRNWLAKYGDLLGAAPRDVFPITEYRSSFIDAVQRDLTAGDGIYGITLYVDTIALYYNTEMFNSAGIVNPPKDWDEFADVSRRLTKRKPNGDIYISGAALGAAKNVSHAPDILALLMIQNGVPLADANGRASFKAQSGTGQAEKALDFYASFAKISSSNFSWQKDGGLTSAEAFSQNKAAMVFGYSSLKNDLLAKNAHLRFGAAPAPQMKNAVFHKNYADYWGFGVYKNSKNSAAAWQFLKFISEPNISRYYLSLTKKPAAQKVLISEQQSDSQITSFATQELTAFSWVERDEKVFGDVFSEMIEAQISSDQPLEQTIRNGEDKINSLIKNRP